MQSTQRGIGPSRQSRPINFELFIMMKVGVDPLVPGGPMGTEPDRVIHHVPHA